MKLRGNFKKYNQTIISRILSNLVQKTKKQLKITKKQLNLDQGEQKTMKKTISFHQNNNPRARQRPGGAAEGGALLFLTKIDCFLLFFYCFLNPLGQI